MKRFLSYLVFFVITLSFAQQNKIDSLKTQLEKETLSKVERLKLLDKLSSLMINSSDTDQAIPYYQKAIDIANELDSISLKNKVLRYLSESYLRKQDRKQAIKYAKLSAIPSDSINNISKYLLMINQLARVYHHFQDYDKAVETYLIGINLTEENPLKKTAILYGNLGVAYSQQGKENKAIKCYVKQAKIAENYDDVAQKGSALYNLAWMYMNLEQYAKAEVYYKKALLDSARYTLKTHTNRNHHGLALNYSHWGKYDLALKENRIALKYYRESGNKLYEFDVLNNIAAVYQRKNENRKALKYANQALKIALEINHKLAIQGARLTIINSLIQLKKYKEAEVKLILVAKDTTNTKIVDLISKLDVYNFFYLINKGRGNCLKSLFYLERFKKLNDSINKNQLDNQIVEIETKYQTEKTAKENLALKASNATKALALEKATQRKNYMLYGIGALVLLAIAFWRRYQIEHKAKKVISLHKDEIEAQKNVIENLQKDLHHRVKNNLAIINSLIADIKKEFSDEDFKLKLEDLQNRIKSINEVHEQLYKNKDITNLKLKEYVAILANNVQQSFGDDTVTIHNDIKEDIHIPVAKSFPIGLIINEFLTNSFKYAFKGKEKGDININLKEQNENYLLELSDNGVGLAKDFDIKKVRSFGMDIMNLLAEQMNGKLTLDGSNGVQIQIQFSKQ